MSQKFIVKFLLAEFLWILVETFLNFLAESMFTLKFWGNNYSEVEQNLLPGSEKGESVYQSSEKFCQVEFYS